MKYYIQVRHYVAYSNPSYQGLGLLSSLDIKNIKPLMFDRYEYLEFTTEKEYEEKCLELKAIKEYNNDYYKENPNAFKEGYKRKNRIKP